MQQPVDVTFKSGGEICRAWHFAAQTDQLTAYRRTPCIVMGHGFGGTRDAGLTPYARQFAANGFHVLVFDYRHFGASDGEPRQLISVEHQLQDWAAATEFARGMPGIDSARIALWGSSFSGGLVIVAACNDRRVAAIVAQCPALDGVSILTNYIRYAGVLTGLRLLLAGITDKVGALLRHPPKLLPIIGLPGSLAFLSTPDSEPGFRAIAPAGWRNEVAARIALELPFFRPVMRIPELSCPSLLQLCDRDQVAPPILPPAVRQRAKRIQPTVKRYDCGHFDIYLGEWFEKSVADQLAFLTKALAKY